MSFFTSTVMQRKKIQRHQKKFSLDGWWSNLLLKLGGKLDRIQVIYDERNKNLIQFGLFHKQISIDESVVPYYDHYSSKMFIRRKPICFRYKISMIWANNDYPYKMEIYTGKQWNEIVPLDSRIRIVKNFCLLLQTIFKQKYFLIISLLHTIW